MTGLDLARRIRDVMTDEGISPLREYTWQGKPNAHHLVTWYGMALNLSGWDYCDECGNEHPEAALVRPEAGADCCCCQYCFALMAPDRQKAYGLA